MRLEQSSNSPGPSLRTGKSELSPAIVSRAAIRAGILTAAGVLALVPEANATTWWWPENDNAVYAPAQPPQKRYPRKHHQLDSRQEKLIEKQATKPQGPLLISVSIDQQKLRVYDANGLLAESPVSTGTRSHATPMGVFSVIQKNKWHRSNIYSGAPMPYMQRITWSGIALHAGMVPGYPASHGCIRMPTAFATKMWGWTRMGARVIVTPGDITPTNFTHALLLTKRPAPPEAPMASDPQTPTKSSKSDKAGATEPANDSTSAQPPELRASISLDEPRASVKTADASATSPSGNVVLSDSSRRQDSSEPLAAPMTTASADAPAESSGGVSKDDSADRTADAPPLNDVSKATGAEPDAVDPSTTATIEKAATPKADESKAVAAEKALPSNEKTPSVQTSDKPDGSPDAVQSKDQSRATDSANKPAAELPVAKRGGGQIAIFVSGKDQKLYVRQNMTPLFDVPVAIAPSDRQLGTHVFTAELAKDDSIRWTVVSLPSSRRTEDQSNSRRPKKNLATEVKASSETDSPAAALDRLTIPPEAMARVAEAITTGASLIVSDQGISASGETGQGTDFIVRLR
ncbi:ErfK/YbiS/YcfS/YnhG [Rhodopseudomonas palustris BisB5]|uniref:ErfK/YbiS/YcfS/YnhG n=1 Tax=Rhodopseudomonas palustris (strain BisB5) TaxID=316057 RepID=Q135S0_RHOPS|nr:ErfK/YbiS/YcfS/YnhG [Rhodopseudomonas palustris BisB5]